MLKTIEIKEVLDKEAFAEIINDRVEFLIEDCILNGKKIGQYDKKRINKKLANLKRKEIMYILGQCDALLLNVKTLDVDINSNYYNFMRHMQDTYAS